MKKIKCNHGSEYFRETQLSGIWTILSKQKSNKENLNCQGSHYHTKKTCHRPNAWLDSKRICKLIDWWERSIGDSLTIKHPALHVECERTECKRAGAAHYCQANEAKDTNIYLSTLMEKYVKNKLILIQLYDPIQSLKKLKFARVCLPICCVCCHFRNAKTLLMHTCT